MMHKKVTFKRNEIRTQVIKTKPIQHFVNSLTSCTAFVCKMYAQFPCDTNIKQLNKVCEENISSAKLNRRLCTS